MTTLAKALDLVSRYDVDTLYDKFYAVAIDDFAGSAVGYYGPNDSEETQADKDRVQFRMIVDEVVSELYNLDEDSTLSRAVGDFVHKYYQYIR